MRRSTKVLPPLNEYDSPNPMLPVRELKTSPLRGGINPTTIADQHRNHINEAQYDVGNCPHDPPPIPSPTLNPNFTTPKVRMQQAKQRRVSPLLGPDELTPRKRAKPKFASGTGGVKHIDCFGDWDKSQCNIPYALPSVNEQIAMENKDLYNK